MIEIKNNPDGQVHIADEVIAIIAGTAALETEGVYGAAGKSDFSGLFSPKNLAKGVKIELDEDKVRVDITVSAKFGFKLPEVSLDVQKRVKQAIETMTALEVSEVNINIVGVHTVKESEENLLVYNKRD